MIRLILLIALSLVAQTNSTFANPNACDDYLARHYKKDLVPQKIHFRNRVHNGRVNIYYQTVTLTVKNTGQVGFPLRTSDNNGWRPLQVRLKGINKTAYIRMPLDSGQSTTVQFAVPAGTLRNCETTSVQIDTNHAVGQWGCAVWNNDAKLLQVSQSGVFGCRVVKPRPRPRPPRKPIRPIRPPRGP